MVFHCCRMSLLQTTKRFCYGNRVRSLTRGTQWRSSARVILLTGKCVSSPWKDVRFAGKFFFIPVSFEGPLFMLFGYEILEWSCLEMELREKYSNNKKILCQYKTSSPKNTTQNSVTCLHYYNNKIANRMHFLTLVKFDIQPLETSCQTTLLFNILSFAFLSFRPLRRRCTYKAAIFLFFLRCLVH